ncbi:substrate-binding domain-containing protein [bacterium]|nr:substrate-binding domain-containing protein [bacterium]
MLLFAHESGTGVEAYRSLVKSRRVDGFILSHTQQDDERFAYLQTNHIPFAAFGRSNSPLDTRAHWVDVDGEAGMMTAVQHLVACGYRRVGFIGWPQGSVSGDGRYSGYVKALQAAGLPLNFNWIRRTQNDIMSGYEAGQDLLTLADAPNAIAAVSDIVAVGILRGIIEHGQRVAVTGFDDTPIAEFSHPPLTSLQQPVDDVARLLMHMLIAQFEKQSVMTLHHMLKPRLVVRASSTLAY